MLKFKIIFTLGSLLITLIHKAMTEYQTAKHNMYRMIIKESSNNQESVNMIPGFKTGIDFLVSTCDQIEATRIEQEKDIKGITTDKLDTLDDLVDSTIEVAGAVFSYADKKGNNTLMEKVNFKESVVEKMSQPDLVTAAGIVLKEAETVPLADLQNEGITPDEMNTFKELLNVFKNVNSSTREAIIDRRGHTKKLAELFRQAYRIKKNTLDRLAPQYKKKAPAFYDKYRAASMIIYKKAAKKTNGESN